MPRLASRENDTYAVNAVNSGRRLEYAGLSARGRSVYTRRPPTDTRETRPKTMANSCGTKTTHQAI
jgi:hypothetical protein